MLTFNAFFAASAPERLSKVTNPTGWKTRGRNTLTANRRKTLHFVKTTIIFVSTVFRDVIVVTSTVTLAPNALLTPCFPGKKHQ